MMPHLRNGWQMAKAGFLSGLFTIICLVMGSWLSGRVPDWTLPVGLPVWVVVFFLGGVLYSVLLPARVRGRPGPATVTRMNTGTVAGTLTACLVALPVVVVGLVSEFRSAFVIALGLVAVGAIVGAASGFIASRAPRHRTPPTAQPGMAHPHPDEEP